MNHTATFLTNILPEPWLGIVAQYSKRYESNPAHWTWLFGLATLSFTVYAAGRRHYQLFFTNKNGQKIKKIRSDVRLWKFVRSAQLSGLGKDLAGNEPYLIQNGPYTELVISQPDHIHDFYRHDAKYHTKPRNFNLGEPFGRLMGNAVGAQYGDHWRRIRKHFDPIFAYHPTMQNLETFHLDITKMLQCLVPDASIEVDLKRSFTFLTFRLLSIYLYGDIFSEQIYQALLKLNDQHEVVIRDMVMSTNMDSKLWNLVPTVASKRLTRYLQNWRQFNLAIVKQARQCDLHCPVATIATGVDQNDMTEKEFLQTLDEILFTNVEVSAAVLGTLFSGLAANHQIQSKLRREIISQRMSGSHDAVKYFASTSSRLAHVIMESMRHSPAFSFSMPECTATTKRIGSYLIPAGTPVIIDTRRLNNDAITWGDDGASFDPDRFDEMSREKLRCGFMRFGVGAASGRCLGKNVADSIFKLIVVAVVKEFRLAASEDGKVRFERIGFD